MYLALQTKYFIKLFWRFSLPAILFFFSNSAYAFDTTASQRYDILAYWTDSQHIVVQVPNNVIPRNSLSFFIRDLASPNNLNIPLQALSYNNEWIILNSSMIPLNQQKDLVRQSVVLDVMSGNFLMQRTGIAMTTILDDLFYTDETLGQIWSSNSVELKLWSPTAQNIKIHLYNSPESDTPAESYTMSVINGIWKIKIPAQYKYYYYLFEVTNFYPELQTTKTVYSTDPYSVGLAADGKKSLLVDLDSADTKPKDWDVYQLPSAVKIKDSVIYENHIRDLTATDSQLPKSLRGKYLGLGNEDSLAYQHLKNLKDSGITHLHLLPFYDFATVPENLKDQESLPEREWSSPDEAPTALARIRLKDNYNWGYDPVHWLSPEGSYATEANGISRIIEIRQMIESLHKLNLHVTQDVVFNHTFASDFSDKSVLNKIVPSYYYRLGPKGYVHSSSCCADTASENRMMEKLMSDSIKHWIKYYHITSFRFDLMSFHSRETMIRLREMIKSELKNTFNYPYDSVLIFGEAWAFGSLYDQHPDQAMVQTNSYGLGIGTFNDRMRDALRGGTTNLSEPSDQGFITGLLDNFNFSPRNRNSPTNELDRREKYLHLKDVVKIGLAGNLRDFSFKEHWGTEQTGGKIRYRGSPVAYAQSPVETINYVSAHDGTTLWDALQAKMSHQSDWATPNTTSLWERVRRHQLALSFVLFSQGVPFVEGGSEILRSKNGDVDSYDSGDFYNALNLDLQTNNWNRALPPAWKNQSEWNFWSARITDKNLSPKSRDIIETLKVFKAMLLVRKNNDLFKMNDLETIQRNLVFMDENFETDIALLPMLLKQSESDQMLIVWNTALKEKTWTNLILNSTNWEITPELNKDNLPWYAELKLSAGSITLPPLSFIILKSKARTNE